MNKNLEHILHAVIIGVVLCIIMTKVLGQSTGLACDRSIVLASVALIYMVMFGHKFPPGAINPSFKF
tara:strand:+ start:1112 stop:1312 length:201 start_codon:yes stop_codon:yes gene_type:complete